MLRIGPEKQTNKQIKSNNKCERNYLQRGEERQTELGELEGMKEALNLDLTYFSFLLLF